MNLWQVIHNENIVKIFIPICVDNFTSKEISMLSIKQVPAIVVSAENIPPSIYEGPVKCSQWLTNFTINRRKNLAQQVDQQRRLIQKAHANVRVQEGGPIEYTEAEMDGISDGYSYNNTDLGQAKSFVTIGDEENHFIRTPQMIENKVDMETMKRQLNELESSRQMDNQQFMKIMEQNQIRSIVNYNNS
jgi:hypothetical protein